METTSLTIKTLLPNTFVALIRLSWCTFRQAINTMFLILTQPLRYSEYKRSGSLSSQYVMLALVFISSVVKFSYDSNATIVLKYIGLDNGVIKTFFPLLVVLSSIVTVIGAYFIPMLWHRVLSIPIEQTQFIIAMIITFASVSVLMDLSFPYYAEYIRDGLLPVYIPDTAKTLIVTIYSMLVGKGIVKNTAEG